MRKLLSIMAIFLAMLFSSAGTGLARQYIDITKPFTRKLPIAITELSPLPGARPSQVSREGRRLLVDDLSYTGLFEILDPKSHLESPTQNRVTYSAWTRIGAELLITGFYRVDGGRLKLELHLYDSADKRRLLGKIYEGMPADLPKIIHLFADEVMYAITKERGVFSSQLAFVGARQTKNKKYVVKEIYRMNFDGSRVRRLTRKGNISLYPRWSPDGRFIVYSSYLNRQPVVFLQTMAGGSGRVVVRRPGVNLTPAFTPSGDRLAVTMSHTGRTNIFLVDLAGKIIKKLTNGYGIDVAPVFSPDGLSMAYVSDQGGTPQIYILNMQSGKSRRLTFGFKYCAAPDWSPRGDRIAFQAMVDGTFQVVSLNPDGSDLQILTSGWGGGEDPSWSPDGRLIAYASRKTGRYQIYVMTANGRPIKRLTNLPGDNTDPAWSPREAGSR